MIAMGKYKYLLCVVLMFSSAKVQAEPYPFVGIKGLAEQEVGQAIFTEICNSHRLKCKIDMLPANRAERSVGLSKSAGEIMRIWEYGIENPDLIRVPTPYYFLQTALLVRDDNRLNIYSLKDIVDVNVGVIRGVKHTQLINANENKLLQVSSTEQLMRLLIKGRIDVAVTSRLDGLSTINKLGTDNIMVLPVELQTHPLYVYVNPEYAHLVPVLDDAINLITHSGELESARLVAEDAVLSKFN